MKKLALVGYGYWGPNLLRNFFETPDCEVLYCCDKDLAKLKMVRRRFPSVIITTSFDEIIRDSELDAVVIATPTMLHYELAKKAIESGKDVLVEKPMTINTKEANDLVALAKKFKKILMVDHTFLYNEAVIRIKEILEKKELGDILYIDSIRANLGLFQKDTNAIFDLASHDLSIIQYLFGKKPISVQAFGKSHYNKQEDICYVIVEYKDGTFTHLSLSWLSPLKVRTMTIIGTRKMLVYDDMNFSQKIQVYEKSVDIGPNLFRKLEAAFITYRSGSVWSPNISEKEALGNMAKDFIESITKRREPISNGKLGVLVMELLEKATQSLKIGKKIILKNAD